MGGPATTSGTATETDVHQQFESAFAQMTTGDKSAKETAAEKFCGANMLVMGETVGFSTDAIAKGTAYTQINAIVGTDGKIGDIKLTPTASRNDISGITYKAQAANASNIYGFYEVVLPTDKNGNVEGPVDVLGLQPNQSNATDSTNPKNGGPSNSDKTQSSNPDGKTPAGGVTIGGKTKENQPGVAPEYSPTTGPHPTPGPTTGPTSPGNTTPVTTPNTYPPGTTPNTTPNTVPPTTTPNTVPPTTTPPPTYPKEPVTTTTISGIGNPIGGS